MGRKKSTSVGPYKICYDGIIFVANFPLLRKIKLRLSSKLQHLLSLQVLRPQHQSCLAKWINPTLLYRKSWGETDMEASH